MVGKTGLIRVTLMLAMALALVPGVISCGDDNAPAASAEVQVKRDAFFPSTIEILAGETVMWVNVLPRSPDNLRTVTSGLVDSTETHGLLFDVALEGYESGKAFGQSYTHKFEERGVWHYFTRNPPEDQFTGIIVVR